MLQLRTQGEKAPSVNIGENFGTGPFNMGRDGEGRNGKGRTGTSPGMGGEERGEPGSRERI